MAHGLATPVLEGAADGRKAHRGCSRGGQGFLVDPCTLTPFSPALHAPPTRPSHRRRRVLRILCSPSPGCPAAMRWGACAVLLGCVTATSLAAAPVPPTFPSSCTLPPTGPLPYGACHFRTVLLGWGMHSCGERLRRASAGFASSLSLTLRRRCCDAAPTRLPVALAASDRPIFRRSRVISHGSVRRGQRRVLEGLQRVLDEQLSAVLQRDVHGGGLVPLARLRRRWRRLLHHGVRGARRLADRAALASLLLARRSPAARSPSPAFGTACCRSSGSGPSAQVRRPFRLQSALCLPSECSEGDVPAIEVWFAYNLCGSFGGSSPTCSASISCDFGVSTSIVVIILSAIGGLAAFCLISCLVCHFCSGRRRRRRDSSNAEGARSRRLSVDSDRLLSDSDYDSSGDEEPRVLVRPGREIGNDFL